MKISVVTAVMNRRETIGEALQSLHSQTYSDVEHIVQDGGSHDGTLAYLEQFRRPEMFVQSAPDFGLYDALNKGISRASGDVIGLLHSDDSFADCHVLERIAEAMADPNIDGVYGDLQYVAADGSGRVVRHWRAGQYTPKRLAWGWMPPHPTLYLRRRVYEELGLYDTSFKIAGDYDGMLRWLKSGKVRLAYITHVQMKMRIGGISNGSVQHVLHKSREDLRAIRAHKVGGLGTLLAKNVSKVSQFRAG